MSDSLSPSTPLAVTRPSLLSRIPRPPWMAVLLVAVILTTYGGTLNHFFVQWDDNGSIVENSDLNPPTPASLARFWNDPLHGYRGFYVPVPYTIWWVAAHIDRQPSGNGPSTMPNEAIFHGLNLAFHTVGAVLVFLLLRKLVKADLPALIGSAIFALHPLQADPICWASSMYTPLSGMLSVAAMLLYLRFSDAKSLAIETPADSREATPFAARALARLFDRRTRTTDGLTPALQTNGLKPALQTRTTDGLKPALRTWLPYAAALLCYALALLTKATIVLLPVMIALIEVVLRRRRLKDCLPLLPWLLIGFGDGLLTHHTQLASEVYVPPMWLRPLVAADGLAFYLYKLAIPVGLIPDYSRSPRWAVSHGWIAVTWVLPALVAVACWRWRGRLPWLWVSAAIFLLGALPTLGLIPYDYQFYSTVADRYVYFSMLGPALAAAFAMRRFAGAPAAEEWARAHAHATPMRPCGPAAKRELKFTGGSSPNRKQVLTEERRLTALQALIAGELVCILLAVLSRTQTSHWQDTRALFGQTLKVNPDSMIAHRQLGFVMLLGADPDEAEDAIAHYRASLKLYPDDGAALSNVGILLTRLHRPSEAVDAFRQAALLRPKEAPIHYNLGNALVAAGRYDEAANAYAQALKLAPAFFDPNLRLADELAAKGDAKAARTHYVAALKARPLCVAAVAALSKLDPLSRPEPAKPPVSPQNAAVDPRE